MSKNLGTNYNHRVTLRLNDDQYNFLIGMSSVLDVTPSDYIRMVINAGLVSSGGDVNAILNKGIELSNNIQGGVGTNENVKTDSNDKL